MRASPRRKPRELLLLTPGDPRGIGAEITWKALQTPSKPSTSSRLSAQRQVLCIGARAPFERLGVPIETVTLDPSGQLQLPIESKRPTVWLLPAPTRAPRGRLLGGYQAGWSVEQAVRLIQEGQAKALVTGPIHKERLQQGGYPFQGHTDFLAHLCGVSSVTMMLANSQLRSSLVTVHTSLRSVPDRLTPEALERAIRQTAEGLQRLWGISKPRLAIAALNPHAGEGGLFGDEEARVIRPTLDRLRKDRSLRAQLIGPLPADTLFAQHLAAQKAERFDAVVSMYHDQGLIPVKLLDFANTVNLTLGLPIIRTSVDHGTAFDIAGKNQADASSLVAALELASRFSRRLSRLSRPSKERPA